MLNRQKTVLAILEYAKVPIERTRLDKLAFLASKTESLAKDGTFYDFLPRERGPFSFAMNRELLGLVEKGFVRIQKNDGESLAAVEPLAQKSLASLAPQIRRDVFATVRAHARQSLRGLSERLYERHWWYGTRSQEEGVAPPQAKRWRPAVRRAVNTIGYQGQSVDGFFAALLLTGVKRVIDVRANPLSRKYGFSRRAMESIGHTLGISYSHVPQLGIPASMRANLDDLSAYERLLAEYERTILAENTEEVKRIASMMRSEPSVLVCMEKDPRLCHRSRLAEAVSKWARLPVAHYEPEGKGWPKVPAGSESSSP